jgi:hypothetical protein
MLKEKTYLNKKNAELEWFRRFSPSLQIPETFDPLMTKFKLMKELKAEMLLKLTNSVTMIWPLKESFPGKKVTYRYQRQDFIIEGHSPLEVYYPGLKTRLNVNGHFTRSGQSATFGLNLALKNKYESHSVRLLCSHLYFETLRVLEGLKIKVDKDSTTALLDSSMTEKDPLAYLEGKPLKVLIVDTTNWNIDSKYIQQIIGWAEVNQVELFLIRSHLKLDCLGAEYGLLGSIVRISENENKEWDKFLLETLSFAGLLAVHEQVYPFLWDEEFLKLTAERTERIRSNTAFFTEQLEPYLKSLKNPMRIKHFHHGLFFGVYYDGKKDHHPEKFLKLSIMHQVPAKYCDSFGFDFISLTNVVSFYESSQESLLRFCSGDNNDNREDALQLLKDYLVFFDQRT